MLVQIPFNGSLAKAVLMDSSTAKRIVFIWFLLFQVSIVSEFGNQISRRWQSEDKKTSRLTPGG
jgi:hypothetical protein